MNKIHLRVVMKRPSKKEFVLEIYDREAMGEVTAREIAIINQALIEEFGEGGSMTPAEIARVLVDEDLPVRFEQIFRMTTPTVKYENLFDGLSFNQSLEEAESSLRQIAALDRQFARLADRTGRRFARETALTAKQNALALANSPALTLHQQDEQREIAQWFTVWLQTPSLFDEWLELRKGSPDFRRVFGQTE